MTRNPTFSERLALAVSDYENANLTACTSAAALSEALRQHNTFHNVCIFLDEIHAVDLQETILEHIEKGALVTTLVEPTKQTTKNTINRISGLHRMTHDDIGHLATLIALLNSRSTAYDSITASSNKIVNGGVTQELISLGSNAASVAHDFNNILTTILGRTQMLLLEATSPQSRRSLESIERTARDGVNVVNQIMRFLDASDAPKMIEEEINSIVSNAVTMVQESARFAETSGIHVETELCSPTFIKLDSAMLTQVLMNLMFNGVDAMSGGGDLKIQVTQDGKSALIQVQDSGCGISKENLERVFEPFYSSKGTKGTGLGLSTSRRVISDHGGTMRIDSEPGRGTTVEILLPVIPSSDTQPDNISTKPVSNSEESKHKAAQILIVDDDESILEILAEILHTSHHTVITAQSADEGLKRFKSEHFDVVFTDLDMPEKSGLDLANAIRNLGSDTPIGFITGWGTSLDAECVKDLGVSRTFPKPFKAAQVLDWVSQAVTNSEL